MSQDVVHESSDEDPTDELNDHLPKKRLSCPSCKATEFPSLSKLNKHRNSHDKPYACPARDCFERFAQRQNLDRHTQSKHGDTKNPAKSYHCIVDGCKYSSTGRRRKRFARADQVKEHIKDFGHYGPHSANDRPRRPGQPLFAEHIIIAHFEEWSLDASGLPQRTVQLNEYNSLKTKLWHTDDTGELYLRADPVGGLEATSYWECPKDNCYYRLDPPGSLNGTVFKTLEGLEEHRPRAHFVQDHTYSPVSQLLLSVPSLETHGSTKSVSSVEPSAFLSEDISLPSDLVPENLTPDLQFTEGMEWTSFDGVIGGDSCNSNQNENTELQRPSPFNLFQSAGDTLQIHFPSISPSSDSTGMHSYLNSNILDEGYSMTSEPNRSTSLSKSEPISLHDSRISCELPGCNKDFRRKGDMKRHVETVHRMSTHFTCSLCRRHFNRKDKVYAHLRNTHMMRPDSEFSKTQSLFTEASDYHDEVDTVSGDALDTSTAPNVSWTEKSPESLPSPSLESPFNWQG